ncbi:hypothetical protein BCR44DRAFT_1132321 [Catenaria anguillulae PL171]|uniref:Uncharacterized protein n=1 Tax=Catenaria anguillulae PL171 TaxID=765915 RepID=A0A1Y2HKG4_9FUNG|nr:hypothetical protein BCR44DRAFT_1132321 [Catenaria anguillulae PL171]
MGWITFIGFLVVPWGLSRWQMARQRQRLAAANPDQSVNGNSSSSASWSDQFATFLLWSIIAKSIYTLLQQPTDLFVSPGLPLSAPSYAFRASTARLLTTLRESGDPAIAPTMPMDGSLLPRGYLPSTTGDQIIALYRLLRTYPSLRSAYAVLGPQPLLTCTYCSPTELDDLIRDAASADDNGSAVLSSSYFVHALPSLLRPYLAAAILFGLATLSARRSGWRSFSVWTILILATLDLCARTGIFDLADLGLGQHYLRSDLPYYSLQLIQHVTWALLAGLLLYYPRPDVPNVAELMANQLAPAISVTLQAARAAELLASCALC